MIFILDEEENKGISILHGKVVSFTPEGRIRVEILVSGESYTITKWDIIGKVAKIIHFGSKDWEEIIIAIGEETKISLKDVIKDILKAVKESEEFDVLSVIWFDLVYAIFLLEVSRKHLVLTLGL
ncbi:hypothetical protein DRO97_08515 [Archaeoglobales archaeon]|nr:MAG: hypothetical protein DRO97_08515 [Archaeoglobales archaeon]